MVSAEPLFRCLGHTESHTAAWRRGSGKQQLFRLFSQAIPGQGGERMLISCCYDDTDFHEGWKWNYAPPGVCNDAAFFAKVRRILVEQVPKPSSPAEELEVPESRSTLETSTCGKPGLSPYTRDLLSWARWSALKAGGPEVTGEVKTSTFGILHELQPTLKVELERVREARVAMGFEGFPLAKAMWKTR